MAQPLKRIFIVSVAAMLVLSVVVVQHWRRVRMYTPQAQVASAVWVYSWPVDYHSPSVPLADYLSGGVPVLARLASGDEPASIRRLLNPSFFTSSPSCLPQYSHAILLRDGAELRYYLVDSETNTCALYENDVLRGLYYPRANLSEYLRLKFPRTLGNTQPPAHP